METYKKSFSTAAIIGLLGSAITVLGMAQSARADLILFDPDGSGQQQPVTFDAIELFKSSNDTFSLNNNTFSASGPILGEPKLGTTPYQNINISGQFSIGGTILIPGTPIDDSIVYYTSAGLSLTYNNIPILTAGFMNGQMLQNLASFTLVLPVTYFNGDYFKTPIQTVRFNGSLSNFSANTITQTQDSNLSMTAVPVPEPSSMFLGVLGLLMMVGYHCWGRFAH